MSNKVLVTGGTGFIGSHLVEKLLTLDKDVTLLDKPGLKQDVVNELKAHPKTGNLNIIESDICNYSSVAKAAQDVDVIYHLAALTSHRLSLEDPHLYITVNIMGVANVLEAARRSGKKPRVVFASSSSVYGMNQPPLVENMKLDPRGPYALSKRMGEELCMLYHELYQVPTVILRYFNVVGERARSNVVITIYAEAISKEKPPLVNGRTDPSTGAFIPASRDFTYVCDIVEGTIAAGENENAVGHVFNLGGGRPRSVMDLANLMLDAMNAKGKLHPITRQLSPHESLTSFANVEKAQRILGWTAKTSLEEIVKRYCDWYHSSP